MRFITDWVTPKSGIIVITAPEVLEIFGKYVQDDGEKMEAGGILLGYRRGPHFQITHATEPTEYDKRSKYHFERSQKIHAKTAVDMWRKSHGHITYLGEWHTHPQLCPSPSILDITEWEKLIRQSTSKSAYVMTIVGTEQLWAGVSLPNGTVTELTPAL